LVCPYIEDNENGVLRRSFENGGGGGVTVEGRNLHSIKLCNLCFTGCYEYNQIRESEMGVAGRTLGKIR
jgi:hypothetical protein